MVRDSDQLVHLVVTGATGRMGTAVVSTARETDAVGSVTAVNRSPTVDSHRGVSLHPADDLATVLDDANADALVDFSGPESSVEYVETAAEAGVACAVGTTGFDGDQRDRLRAASEDAPVLDAPNFAPGVQLLLAAVADIAGKLPGYDVEITGTYHNGKIDAPSGTVRSLADAIADARGEGERVYGRQGDAPREGSEIGLHARRAGDVTGTNEVLFAGNHEVLSLTQRAEDRGVFAAGAVDAAVAIAGKPPGQYDLLDVLGEHGEAGD